MSEIVNIELPDIGDFEDVEVIEILKSPGDRVAVEDSLITVESDKASVEIPSPKAGVVSTVLVKLGDKVYLNAGVSMFYVPDAELFTEYNWGGNLGIVIPFGAQ